MVYVDDIVIIGTDSTLITHLQQHLQASFDMKDLGPLTYFLGLEVPTDSIDIFFKSTQVQTRFDYFGWSSGYFFFGHFIGSKHEVSK